MIWPNIWRQELFVCQAIGIIIAERGRMDFVLVSNRVDGKRFQVQHEGTEGPF